MCSRARWRATTPGTMRPDQVCHAEAHQQAGCCRGPAGGQAPAPEPPRGRKHAAVQGTGEGAAPAAQAAQIRAAAGAVPSRVRRRPGTGGRTPLRASRFPGTGPASAVSPSRRGAGPRPHSSSGLPAGAASGLPRRREPTAASACRPPAAGRSAAATRAIGPGVGAAPASLASCSSSQPRPQPTTPPSTGLR